MNKQKQANKEKYNWAIVDENDNVLELFMNKGGATNYKSMARGIYVGKEIIVIPVSLIKNKEYKDWLKDNDYDLQQSYLNERRVAFKEYCSSKYIKKITEEEREKKFLKENAISAKTKNILV